MTTKTKHFHMIRNKHDEGNNKRQKISSIFTENVMYFKIINIFGWFRLLGMTSRRKYKTIQKLHELLNQTSKCKSQDLYVIPFVT